MNDIAQGCRFSGSDDRARRGSVYFLAVIAFLFTTQSQAVSLSMSLDDDYFSVPSGTDIVEGTHDGTKGYIQASTGTFKAQARTTAEEYMYDLGGGATELRTRVNDSQAIIRMEGFRLNYVDPDSPYVLADGDIGIHFDTNYYRDLTNAEAGAQLYSIRMDAQHWGPGGFISSDICTAGQTINFTDTTISESVGGLFIPNGSVPPHRCVGVGTEITTHTVDAFEGVLKLPGVTLAVGEYLKIQVFLVLEADVYDIFGGPYLPVSELPEAFTDSYFSAQMFLNADPGLFEDEFGQQVGWVGPTVVPVPAAVWLFGSALGLLGWMRRRDARLLQSSHSARTTLCCRVSIARTT